MVSADFFVNFPRLSVEPAFWRKSIPLERARSKRKSARSVDGTLDRVFSKFAFDSQAIFVSQTDENRVRNYFESAFRSRSASELLLGAFWARFLLLLGVICCSWATSWPSWDALGWPGCPLGRPWAVLGRSEIGTNLDKTRQKLQNGLPGPPWVAWGAFLGDFCSIAGRIRWISV